MYVGTCAKTPWNMKTLAANFLDDRWTINDVVLRAEVERMALDIEKNLTEEERAFHVNRRLESTRMKGFEKGSSLAPTFEKEEEQLKIKQMDMTKKEKELEMKLKEITERENEVSRKEVSLAQNGVDSVAYQREALMEMRMGKLRDILKIEQKITPRFGVTKAEMVDDIMKAQGISDEVIEPVIVEKEVEPVAG